MIFERKKFENFDLNVLFENIHYDLLYLRFFNLKKNQTDKLLKLEDEISSVKKEIIENNYINAKGVYKIFKVSKNDNFINVFDDKGNVVEKIETIRNKNGVCIADFLNEEDWVGFISTSVFVDENIYDKFIEKKDFSKLYIINSLSIMMAEAFIEVLHYYIRRDFGICENTDLKELYKKPKTGLRYSPGYPGLDISVNKKIYALLNAKELGSKITSSYMIEPESSVQALVLFSNNAKYL